MNDSKLEQLKCKFPLHFAVWNNDLSEIKRLLDSNDGKTHLEQRDPRNRTPLMLSVALGYRDICKELMHANANVNIEDSYGFNVLHEAVSSADVDLIQQVLERRDIQRYTNRVDGIPNLLRKIRDTPDFYVEMKWEFTSWVPLVSRMCPSDTYKIYKSGSSVRIDTTLLGFDQSNWQRGSRSFVFKGQEDGAIFMEIDHDLQQVHTDTMKVISPEIAETLNFLKPTPDVIQTRLTSPTTITYIDTDKINFERSKSGIIGFRTDRIENVNGYECKVFTANNVEIVTRTRTEHLSKEDKAKYKAETSSRLTPFQSLLGMIEIEDKHPEFDVTSESPLYKNVCNPYNITAEQYFDENFDLGDKDIGRPREMTTKTQRFKANLWLCEEYPLSLPEQVLPIVDLMAISSSHFAKLRDFITLQLPTGFPVKIEIPLFHVMNARITFGNIFSFDEPVNGVTAIKDENVAACVVEDTCFEPPHGYRILGNDELRQWTLDEEEELMQMALSQYVLEDGAEDQVTLWEALRHQPDSDLQRAIQESLLEEFQRKSHNPNPSSVPSAADQNASSAAFCESENSSLPAIENCANGHLPRDLSSTTTTVTTLPPTTETYDWNEEIQLAIRLSQQQKEEEDKRRLKEDEILEQVLKLSLTEK